jgi:hypothetical protein
MKNENDDTVETVMESLRDSLTDHDVGWANVEHAPIFFYHKDKTEAHRAFMIISVMAYKPSGKKFKITIEESY